MPASFPPLRFSNAAIFLNGFMGSGKSYWGKIWSEHYQLAFYDLDLMIENNQNLSINEIFQQKGEPYFRSAETGQLRAFEFKSNFIVACGGGTACFNNNMEWMNKHGVTLFLNPSVKTIVSRLQADPASRPLINNLDHGELLLFAERKLGERNKYYMKSNFILAEENINLHSLDLILRNK